MLQFPTPFRIAGGANTQLPGGNDGFMANQALLRSAASLLSNGGGTAHRGSWLLLQSNVEDVALAMRSFAEGEGLVAATEEDFGWRPDRAAEAADQGRAEGEGSASEGSDDGIFATDPEPLWAALGADEGGAEEGGAEERQPAPSGEAAREETPREEAPSGRERFVSGERGERRRARAERLSGSPVARASGPGWLRANPLGDCPGCSE